MGKLVLTLGSSFEDVKKSVIQKVNEKSDLDNVIIVPDRFSLLAELSVFQEKNIKCMFQTSVMPITKFATGLLEKINLQCKVISSDEEAFLIRRAIQKVKDSFCCLAPNLSPSMSSEIAKTIAQLKSCKISSEDLDVENMPFSVKGKMADIKQIYEEYESMLTGGFDGAKMLATFEQNIEKMTFLQNTNLFFVGFDSLTTQIFDIIKMLQKVTNLIVVGGFYHFNQNNKRIFETDIFDKFKTLPSENPYEVEYIKSTLLPWQEHINKNVFAAKQSEMENNDHVMLLSCENQKQEMQFVAAEIMRNIKQNGMKFSDFSISHSQLTEVQDEFEEILKSNGINYYFDTSVLLSNTSYAKFILSFFTLILSNFEMTEVKNFFSSHFVFSVLSQQSQMILLIEKYLIEKSNFEQINQISVLKEDKQIFPSLVDLVKKVLVLAQKAQQCKTVADFAKVTEELVATFDCEKKIDTIAQELQHDLKQQKIYQQTFTKVNDCLQSILKFLSEEELSLKEYLDILSNAFSQKKISTVPISGDCVFIGDPSDSFFKETKTLFVMGASYDLMPKVIFDAGLVNDDNIEQLRQMVEVSPTTRMINKRNKFKLLSLLTKPSEKLIVTYESISSEGKENLPSSFVLDLKNIFTMNGEPLKIVPLSKHVKVAYDSFENQANYVLTNLTNLGAAKEFLFKHAKNDLFDQKIINTVYECLKSKNAITEGELGLFSNPIPMPKITSAKELFFPKAKTKVSQMERYFSSPFKHFLNYGLNLKEVPTGEIQKNDIGNLMHFVAETFIQENSEQFETISENQIKQIAQEIMQRAKDDSSFYKFFLNNQNKTLFAYLTYEAINLCEVIVTWQKKSNFKANKTEQSINAPNYFEKQQISLTGRVDRVDEFENYFSIIDYKTGKIEFSPKVVYTGQKIQLLIYADIFEKQTGKQCAGIFYFPIKNNFEMNRNVQLEGAFLKDEHVIFNLDNTLSEENPSSAMIKAKLKKTKAGEKFEFYESTGTNYLKHMIAYAKMVCENAIDEILSGHIEMVEEDTVSVFDAFDNPVYQKLKQRKLSVNDSIFQAVTESKNEKRN